MSTGTSDPDARGAGPARGAGEGRPVQFIGFRVDGTVYAVAIRTVREIVHPPPVTRLPQCPPEVEGLINLRGTVLPVISLRAQFGLPATPPDDRARVVVVTVGGKTIGLLVDAVTHVLRVAEDEVQPPPPGFDSVARGAIAGLFRDGDRLVVALDVDRLLSWVADEPDGGPDR